MFSRITMSKAVNITQTESMHLAHVAKQVCDLIK